MNFFKRKKKSKEDVKVTAPISLDPKVLLEYSPETGPKPISANLMDDILISFDEIMSTEPKETSKPSSYLYQGSSYRSFQLPGESISPAEVRRILTNDRPQEIQPKKESEPKFNRQLKQIHASQTNISNKTDSGITYSSSSDDNSDLYREENAKAYSIRQDSSKISRTKSNSSSHSLPTRNKDPIEVKDEQRGRTSIPRNHSDSDLTNHRSSWINRQKNISSSRERQNDRSSVNQRMLRASTLSVIASSDSDSSSDEDEPLAVVLSKSNSVRRKSQAPSSNLRSSNGSLVNTPAVSMNANTPTMMLAPSYLEINPNQFRNLSADQQQQFWMQYYQQTIIQQQQQAFLSVSKQLPFMNETKKKKKTKQKKISQEKDEKANEGSATNLEVEK